MGPLKYGTLMQKYYRNFFSEAFATFSNCCTNVLMIGIILSAAGHCEYYQHQHVIKWVVF